MSQASNLLQAFSHVKQNGSGWMARCPAHDDQRASLSIGVGNEGRWLLKCHAGCSVDAILAAVHLETAHLFPATRDTESLGGRTILAEYPYHDEERAPLYQVVRLAPKDFRQRRPDGRGGWLWNLNDTRRVLYRLPDLHGRRTVFVAEGEKDCDRLWTLGLPATTNAGGAGKWRSDYAEQLKRAGCEHVIVLPDNDPPGETHGRAVARSCVDAGLDVKLIPLPGLARKADVSDWLDVPHSKDELLQIVKDAPLFRASQLVAAAVPMALTSLADLLEEPDDHIEYLVEDRIPAGSVVLFVGAPKTGKSHASRELALAVSRGDRWLGWRTSFGTVWVLVFEDKRSEVRRHYRTLGATGREPVRFFIDQAPADVLPQLKSLAEKERPALIIVDTLARALRLRDFNDYALVSQGFDPLLKLSRATGATLLLLHHASTHVNREGLDAVLGSTAMSASVDNILILKRTDDHRILSSVQRIGPDLEPTIINLNAETGRLERAGTKRQVDENELADRILTLLGEQPEPVTESFIRQNTEGRAKDQSTVLRRLLGRAAVHRTGGGAKGNPYRYALADYRNARSQDSTDRSVGNENRERELSGANKGDNLDFSILVPEFPIRTSGNENPSTYLNPTTASDPHDSRSLVPTIHETAPTTATEHREPLIDSGLDSRSRVPQNGAEYERF